MNKILSISVALALVLLTACDEKSMDERFEKVEISVARNVLIEDFTGQRCINCPTAADELARLQETYGEDHVVVVAIHSGPYGHRSTMTSPRLSLCTEAGDDYYSHWGVMVQPSAQVNRSGSLLESTSEYATAIAAELQKATPLTLSLTPNYDAESRKLTVSLHASSTESRAGRYQVWLTESGIVDAQSMPDGSRKTDYVHNHVFRTSLTSDLYGDDFSVNVGEAWDKDVSTTLDPAWKPENMSIVAFVYTDAGVEQVVTAKF